MTHRIGQKGCDQLTDGVPEFGLDELTWEEILVEDVKLESVTGDVNVFDEQDLVLRACLKELMTVEQSDKGSPIEYGVRNRLVLCCVAAALAKGYPAGFGRDEKGTPGLRTVAYINLPSGQVSWHLPEFPDEWDGHTTMEKWRRIAEYCLGKKE